MMVIRKIISLVFFLLVVSFLNIKTVSAEGVEGTWSYSHSQSYVSNINYPTGYELFLNSTRKFKVTNNNYGIRYYYDLTRYQRLDEICFEIREKGTGFLWSDKLIYDSKCYYVHELSSTKSGLEGKIIYYYPDGGIYYDRVINYSFEDLIVSKRIYLFKEGASQGDWFVQNEYKKVTYYIGIAKVGNVERINSFNVAYSTTKTDIAIGSYYYDYTERYQNRTDDFGNTTYTNKQYVFYGDVYLLN